MYWKYKYHIISTLFVLALFLAACNAAIQPVNFEKIRNDLPPVSPNLIKNIEAMPHSYAKFTSLLKSNPQEIRDGDIIIAMVNNWPITLGELAFVAAQEEILLNNIPDYEKIFIKQIDEKVAFSIAEEKHVLPTSEELTNAIEELKQKYSSTIEPEDSFENVMERLGINQEDYWETFQPYYAYKNLAFEAVWQIIYDETSYTEENNSNPDSYYWDEYLSRFMRKAKIVYVTKIPELQFGIVK